MILASQSPRRIELMREAGYDFEVIPADIDERVLDGENPFELVERLSCAKAQAIAQADASRSEVIVAADTIVALENQLLGKPVDADDAKRMLRELSGKTHQVATGVCMIKDGVSHSFVDVTDVTFYELSDEQIDSYVASGEPMDKAGAYGIQGMRGRMLVQKIDGDFYNVVGLPIAKVARALSSL